VDALASFCAGSQLLSLGDPSQQQQQQQGADASQRRRSGLLLDGAACSQAAACLGEPKASIRCGSRSLCTAAGRTSLQPIPEAQSPYLASVLSKACFPRPIGWEPSALNMSALPPGLSAAVLSMCCAGRCDGGLPAVSGAGPERFNHRHHWWASTR
jgi:hypothetical protein